MPRVTTRVVPRGVSTVPSPEQPPVNGGQRRSTTADHRWTTGQRWLTASQQAVPGQGIGR
ncbi:hypothetical protein Tco_0398637, partial [Tanacetum coccineum]